MAIRHNLYEGGLVHSLGFYSDGTDQTLGVVSPGAESDFGEAKREETITVLDGGLRVNGQWYKKGETVVIPRGHRIMIMAEKASACRCVHGPPEGESHV